MPTMPTMPALPRMPKIQLPNVQLPKVQLPKVQLPTLASLPTLPRLQVAQVEHEVVAVARDAAYASIGLGVLAIQQAQRGVAAVTGQLRRYAK
jgi:hypothetical protein